MVAHANAMLDAYIYGFALVEASLPSQAEGEFVGAVANIASALDADAPAPTSSGSPSSTCSSPATRSATRSKSVSTFFSRQ